MMRESRSVLRFLSAGEVPTPEKRGDETPLSKGAAESISFALPVSRKQINRAYIPVLNDGGMAPCHTNSSL